MCAPLFDALELRAPHKREPRVRVVGVSRSAHRTCNTALVFVFVRRVACAPARTVVETRLDIALDIALALAVNQGRTRVREFRSDE